MPQSGAMITFSGRTYGSALLRAVHGVLDREGEVEVAHLIAEQLVDHSVLLGKLRLKVGIFISRSVAHANPCSNLGQQPPRVWVGVWVSPKAQQQK